MADGRSETAWRQGCILTAEDATALGLIPTQDAHDQLAIVISHDCDLVEGSETEPTCEVVIANKIPKVDGTFANAKNPRRLHLSFSAGAETVCADLSAINKKQIPKADLEGRAPNSAYQLISTELWNLRAWLSARYQRPSLPDEFDRRLKQKPAEMHKRIAAALKNTGNDIVAVLLDVDNGRPLVEKESDDPYSLGIFVLYSVSEDPARAEAAAKRIAQSIKSSFRQHYFVGGRWQGIEFRDCIPVSEDALSVYQWRMLTLWQSTEFSSLSDKPENG